MVARRRGVGLRTALAMMAVAAVFLMVASRAVEAAISSNVTIAILYTTGQFASIGSEVRVVSQLFRQYVNSQPKGFGNTGIGVDLVFKACGDTIASAKLCTTQVLNGTRQIDYILAPYSSDLSLATLLVANAYPNVFTAAPTASAEEIWQCGTDVPAPCTAPNTRRFARALSAQSPASYYLQPFISLMKIQQAKTIALLSEAGAFPLASCVGAQAAAESNRLTITYNRVIPTQAHSATSAASDDDILLDAMRAMNALDPDAVVGCFYQTTCYRFVELAYDNNLDFKALAFTTCAGSAMTARLGDKARYIFGPVQWDFRLDGVEYRESTGSLISMFPPVPVTNRSDGTTTAAVTSPAAFNSAIKKITGTAPSYQAASSLAGLYQIYGAIAAANSSDISAVTRAAASLYESSFYGVLFSDRYGKNTQKSMATLQYDGNSPPNLVLVTPLSAAEANPIYPTPKWAERIYTHTIYAQPIEIVVLAMTAFSVAVSVAILILIGCQRHSRVLRAISVEFCGLTVIGCIIAMCAVLGFPLENNDATCATHPWLITIGGSLILSPLLTKEWRIDRIFNTVNIIRVNISNTRLLVETIAMLMPQVIISVVWMIVARPVPAVVTVDPIRPSLNYTECVYPDLIYPALSFAYVVFQLCVVCVLAFRIRHVSDDFNQARSLGVGAYLMLISWTVIVTIELVGLNNRRVAYGVRSFLVLLSFLAFEYVIVGNKLAFSRLEFELGHSGGKDNVVNGFRQGAPNGNTLEMGAVTGGQKPFTRMGGGANSVLSQLPHDGGALSPNANGGAGRSPHGNNLLTVKPRAHPVLVLSTPHGLNHPTNGTGTGTGGGSGGKEQFLSPAPSATLSGFHHSPKENQHLGLSIPPIGRTAIVLGVQSGMTGTTVSHSPHNGPRAMGVVSGAAVTTTVGGDGSVAQRSRPTSAHQLAASVAAGANQSDALETLRHRVRSMISAMSNVHCHLSTSSGIMNLAHDSDGAAAVATAWCNIISEAQVISGIVGPVGGGGGVESTTVGPDVVPRSLPILSAAADPTSGGTGSARDRSTAFSGTGLGSAVGGITIAASGVDPNLAPSPRSEKTTTVSHTRGGGGGTNGGGGGGGGGGNGNGGSAFSSPTQPPAATNGGSTTAATVVLDTAHPFAPNDS